MAFMRLRASAREISRGDAADVAFGIVTALPEEFAAMRAMIDNAGRWHDADDRADYVLGTVPSLDSISELAGESNGHWERKCR
jgi:hypothetical protein